MFSNCLIVLGKCVGQVDMGYEIHFKGHYKGGLVKRINVINDKELGSLVQGEEYLLFLKEVSFFEGVLQGSLVRVKKLDSY